MFAVMGEQRILPPASPNISQAFAQLAAIVGSSLIEVPFLLMIID